MREEITVDLQDKKISFSRQTMREEVFEKIFYAVNSKSLLRAQQLVIVTTSFGIPPHYPLEWINLQPWPVFHFLKRGGLWLCK